jgi:hypothetical protein
MTLVRPNPNETRPSHLKNPQTQCPKIKGFPSRHSSWQHDGGSPASQINFPSTKNVVDSKCQLTSTWTTISHLLATHLAFRNLWGELSLARVGSLLSSCCLVRGIICYDALPILPFGLVGVGQGVVLTAAATGALGCSLHLFLSVFVHRTSVRGEVRVERIIVPGW